MITMNDDELNSPRFKGLVASYLGGLETPSVSIAVPGKIRLPSRTEPIRQWRLGGLQDLCHKNQVATLADLTCVWRGLRGFP